MKKSTLVQRIKNLFHWQEVLRMCSYVFIDEFKKLNNDMKAMEKRIKDLEKKYDSLDSQTKLMR